MKTKIIRKLLVSFGLVFVLGSAITQVRGLVRSFPVAVAFPFIVASLRRSLEVFNNDTGATTVCMRGAAPKNSSHSIGP